MVFGVEKCAVINVERGRFVSSEFLAFSDNLFLELFCKGETLNTYEHQRRFVSHRDCETCSVKQFFGWLKFP